MFNDVITHLVLRFRDMLYWDSRRLTYPKLMEYAEAIRRAGGIDGIWGFIDGTQRAICRPEKDQQVMYSGYKRNHTFKCQAIITPDGIISHLCGPFEGKLGDWRMWNLSNLEQTLHIIMNAPDSLGGTERILFIYRDLAYIPAYGIMGGYKARVNHPLTEQQKAMNAIMSEVRVSVEHGFGKVMQNWSYIGFRNGLKIGLSPVGAYYMVSVLLTNIHTCLRGSQTSAQFEINPPSLEEYFDQ